MKGFGYLVSTISVLLLGAVAWPKPDEPRWKVMVLIAGMATSILGMLFRFIAHWRKERELAAIEQRVGLPVERPSSQRAARDLEPARAVPAISSVD